MFGQRRAAEKELELLRQGVRDFFEFVVTELDQDPCPHPSSYVTDPAAGAALDRAVGATRLRAVA